MSNNKTTPQPQVKAEPKKMEPQQPQPQVKAEPKKMEPQQPQGEMEPQQPQGEMEPQQPQGEMEPQQFNLAFLDKTTSVITAKKALATAINSDVRGLGSCFSSLRRNKKETEAMLREHKKPLCKEALHEILNVGNFNLFRAFLTDDERNRSQWTGNQIQAVLLRAAAKTEEAYAIRAPFLEQQQQ